MTTLTVVENIRFDKQSAGQWSIAKKQTNIFSQSPCFVGHDAQYALIFITIELSAFELVQAAHLSIRDCMLPPRPCVYS